jgi:hypothetical protein
MLALTRSQDISEIRRMFATYGVHGAACDCVRLRCTETCLTQLLAE